MCTESFSLVAYNRNNTSFHSLVAFVVEKQF